MPPQGMFARFLKEWRTRGTALRRWLNGTLIVLGAAFFAWIFVMTILLMPAS